MAGILERIQRARRPPLHSLSPAEARQAYLAGAEVLEPPRVSLARVEDLRVQGAGGAELPARLYAPSASALPVLLYLHGGGFVIGGLETHDSLCRQLALRSGAAVLSLDYRLAPEHRFPTAVDDCFAALRWLAGGGAVGLDLPAGVARATLDRGRHPRVARGPGRCRCAAGAPAVAGRSDEPVRGGGRRRSPCVAGRWRPLRGDPPLCQPLCAAWRAEVHAAGALCVLRLARWLDHQVRPVEPGGGGRGARRTEHAQHRGQRRWPLRDGGQLPAAHTGAVRCRPEPGAYL
ncbi:MAG: alpha/beta hydrolase [Burkholderiales bacterium]|nr:alpha/beta hydrolase [Burkholderiales bacterium]